MLIRQLHLLRNYIGVVALTIFFAADAFGQGTKLPIWNVGSESVTLVIYNSPVACKKNVAVEISFPSGLHNSTEWLVWKVNFKDCNRNIKYVELATPIGSGCSRSEEFLSIIQSGASSKLEGEHTTIFPKGELSDIDVILDITNVRIVSGYAEPNLHEGPSKGASLDGSSVVLIIDGESIGLKEFENIFKKNNQDLVITEQRLDDYMELFINFKLKVKQAREAGLDTTMKFKNELARYRAQLARPYFADSEKLNDLVKEAYENYQKEVHAAHILIKIDASATPADTVRAYSKIQAIRERIIKGEEFKTLAEATSEDPSTKENGGDLGYFTAFQMVYPFEKAAYEIPVGQVSNPIRTRYGYHLIYVYDKRPSRGEMHVAHIVVKPKSEQNSEAKAETKIQEIYQRLVSRESTFEELAIKYSDDPTSAKKGGELLWIGTGDMILEFEDAAFALKNNGDYSAPFKTAFGWHIVKRLEYRPLASFESMKNEIKSKVLKDSRIEQTKKSFLEKLKKEYSYAIDKDELSKLIEKANSNVFEGSFDLSKKAMDQALIRMKGGIITVGDFNDHLRSIGMSDRTMSPGDYILNSAMKFGEEKLLQLEDAKLEEKHEPFRVLMKEYYEGILLFEISEQMVFSKAVNDALGLMTFYNLNKMKFMWPERANVVIYKCSNADIARKVRRMAKEGMGDADIIRELNQGAQLNCQVQEGVYSKDDNLLLSKIPWRIGLCEDVFDQDQVYVVQFKEILAPSAKSMEEAREMITSEYQEFLEMEWIRSLRSQHTFTVDRALLHTIK